MSEIDHRQLAKAIVDELLSRLAPAPPPTPAPTNAEPLYLTVSAYAKRIGWSRSTVQTWVKAGMPTVPTRRGARVEVRSADEWMRLGGVCARARGGQLDG